MAKALSAAAQKKVLTEEYITLALVKLGLNFEGDTEYVKVIRNKSLTDIKGSIARMKRMENYTDAPAVLDMPLETQPEARVSRGDGNTMGYGKAKRSNEISDAQKGLIIRLTKEKHGVDLEAEGNESLLEVIAKLSKPKASEHIDRLIKMPRKVSPAAPAPAVITMPAPARVIPAGIYAIQDDEIKCYEVDHGKAGGKWEGFLFLSRVSSDDRWPIKNREEKARILAAIQADVEAAGVLAAHTLRRCRNPKCKRLLTDTKNPYFAEGFGPECGAKREW